MKEKKLVLASPSLAINKISSILLFSSETSCRLNTKNRFFSLTLSFLTKSSPPYGQEMSLKWLNILRLKFVHRRGEEKWEKTFQSHMYCEYFFFADCKESNKPALCKKARETTPQYGKQVYVNLFLFIWWNVNTNFVA